MGCFSPDAPPPRDYAKETTDTLEAQLKLAPEKYAAEAKYGPLYQQLTIDQLRSATPQLLDIYQKQLAPGLAATEAASRSAARAGDIADVTTLGPQARAAIKAMNPEQARLVETLTMQAQQGLDAGTQLTPDQARMAQQQARQAWAARGLSQSPGAAVSEVLSSQLAGLGQGQMRQQNALTAFGANQTLYGDPWQQILGRPSQSFSMVPGVAGQAGGMNPGALFNPESQYAADINNQNYQGQLSSNIAGASNMSGLLGGGLGAVGNVLGGSKPWWLG